METYMNGLIRPELPKVGFLYRIKEFDINWVLDLFSQGDLNRHANVSDLEEKIIVDGFTYLVKKGRPKYKLFKLNGPTCVQCGITANKCFMEMTVDVVNVAHFNFYNTLPGSKEIMITIDHIIPRSKGGRNWIDNYQVMCFKCNNQKGTKMPKGFIV